MDKQVKKLTANDWLEAALQVLASDGASAVSVEPLAKKLGVTKGSFYWHFKNRKVLIQNLLEYWEGIEKQYTAEYLSQYPKPDVFLAESLTILIQDDVNKCVFLSLSESKEDLDIEGAYRRAVNRRLDVWENAYNAMGLNKKLSHDRAYETYCSYFGLIKLLVDQPVNLNQSEVNRLIKRVIAAAICI